MEEEHARNRPSRQRQVSLPVCSRNQIVALTTFKSGFHLSLGPSTNCPLLSFFIPNPPRRKGTSPTLPSAATQSSLRSSAHCGHDKITCRIVSSPCLHSQRALSTKPPLERYWFNRQCPVLAWIRIADWSDVSDRIAGECVSLAGLDPSSTCIDRQALTSRTESDCYPCPDLSNG
jgi:hypothetical protein